MKAGVKFLPFLLAASLVASSAQAQMLMGMGAFFNGIKTQPGRVEGRGFSFPAYVKDIEVVASQGATPLAVIELGNDKANGVVITWGANELRCLVPPNDAARLVRGQSVAAKGRVVEHRAEPRSNPLVGQVTVHVVVALCGLRSIR